MINYFLMELNYLKKIKREFLRINKIKVKYDIFQSKIYFNIYIE
jgi:hypothetical protein